MNSSARIPRWLRLSLGLLLPACLLCLSSCGGSGGGGGGNAAAFALAAANALPPAAAGNYTPLSWPDKQPATQYKLADGTLVTRVGGRTRDRHAREIPDTPGTGDPYLTFAPHYFERRTHDITIYDNASPTDPGNRVLTVVVRPQWWLYGTNFRHSYIGRRDADAPYGPSAVALYGDNGGMKRLPPGSLLAGQELKTPVANYDALPEDPNGNYDTDLNVPPNDGEFVLVKQITTSASLRRPLRSGDLIEFELGIFLAGNQGDALGRFNYYAEAMVYQVGQPGVQPWFRGPCCNTGLIPWDSHVLPPEAQSGGAMLTLQEDTSGQPEMNLLQAGTNIAGINIQPFVEGRRLFHTSFLTGAHAEAGNPTLFATQAGKAGPKFQQASCIACHTGNGKSTPGFAAPLMKMVVLTGDDAAGQPVVDGRFGGHLEQGLVTEGAQTFDGRQATLKIDSYAQTAGWYPDGTPYTLQAPHYALTDLAGKPLALPAHLSVRAAPHLTGMGLLEAVPESSIEAMAKASAADPDGAVGRLQIVADVADPALKRVGRFGWRATSATVQQQTVNALNDDMGVTTTLRPTHGCGLATDGAACRGADARGPELNDHDLELVVRYLSLLAVPPARHFAGEQPQGIQAPVIQGQSPTLTAAQVDAENTLQARVLRGGQLFAQARCTACHAASLATGDAHRFAELRGQTIHPFTDLLLHDMGPELADSFAQGQASPQEWRTAPLWGIGLLQSIDPNVRYLHDGRARTLEEAILWHAGQGQASRERFKGMNVDDRQKLVDFLKSL